jgi:hypothetical protein
VAHGDDQGAGGVAVLAQSASQSFGELAQDASQFGAIVGVGCEDVRHATGGLHSRRDHRSVVDAVGVLVQRASCATERGAECLLADCGYLADLLEVIVVESFADRVGHFGEQLDGFGCEERCLVSGGDRPDQGAAFALDHGGGGGAHQLVGGDADGQRQAQRFAGLAGDPVCDVDRWAEQSFGAGDVEVCVAPVAGFDEWGEAGQDLVQRLVGAGPAPGVGRSDDQVGADPPGQSHRGPHGQSGLACLPGQREDDGAIGAERRECDGSLAERRIVERGHGGAEGGWVDEEDGFHLKA